MTPIEIANKSFELLLNCGRKETNEFEKNNFAYTDELIFQKCRRHLMRWIYHSLVNRGKIIAIEKLDQEQKAELWEFVKETCAGKTNDLVILKEICKVFTALNYFIGEKYK